MITIIHGEDALSSRNFFIEQKEKVKNPLTLEGETLILSELVQNLDGNMLFSTTNEIFIEDFFSKRKPGKDFDDIIDYLQKKNEANIYFFERKKLAKKNSSVFKNATVKTFDFPKSLFQFLDNIKPKNTKNIIMFHDVIKTVEVELVLFMLIRQFRLLLALSDGNLEQSIDEVKRLAPWQSSKLKRQARYFSVSELINIYKKLYEIDLAMKTGGSSLSLEQAIDFFLLDL